MAEIWTDIRDFEGYYQVSSLGRVRSLDRTIVSKDGKIRFFMGKVLKPKTDRYGYLVLMLRKRTENICKTVTVHRLVAEAFIPNEEIKPEINHINGVKTDNAVLNLEWVTRKENADHAIRCGLIDVEHFRRDITKRANERRKKRVWQLLNGNVIAAYDSISEAVQSVTGKKTAATNIRECCLGKRKKAYGFQWKFAN